MRVLRLLTVFLYLLAAGDALAQKVAVDYDHSLDFSRFKTYSWHKVKAGNTLWEQRITDQVDKDLQAKGWRRTTDGQVMLTAVGSTQNRKEYETFYNGMPGWGWHHIGASSTTTVENYRTGTLVLDMYDASSHRLLWRGTARDVLADNPDKNVKKLDKAIDKLLHKFPPNGKR